ncbi:uncharacterized protein PpBr36_11409, partial [Pyricularia pennisetigena]|uniref:uncharacterized protein n=1 Tax=Pyricularia pennisetigena TaxID=1578925 RepID=UPI00114F2788
VRLLSGYLLYTYWAWSSDLLPNRPVETWIFNYGDQAPWSSLETTDSARQPRL